ncbi:MAG: AEC family transporter [Thermoguttaceae bacterium]|nr:AEC family transporter [Thermoguttaceae bacterium]MBQ3333128.1 AEC family transporter [Thermoguttaceae bacterium]MBQ3454620.1 AEC family transporter [Thermoguttaceae bacterium]
MTTISFTTTLSAVAAAYAVMACGPVVRRLGWLKGEADVSLLKIVVNLLMPCLIASKVLRNDVFTIDTSNLYIPPLLGFSVIAFGIALAYLAARLLPIFFTGLDTPAKKGTFAACVGMLNYGYVPIPLIADLFPNDDRLMAVLFVANLGTEFALWTICAGMIRGQFDRGTLRSMLSIPTIAILLCLALNVLGIDRYIPDFFFKPVGMLGGAAIPLSLLFVGATLGDHFRSCLGRGGALQTVRLSILSILLRLVMIPAVILLAASAMPISREMKIIMVVYASMASATFPVVLVKLHHGDMDTALKSVLSNSLVALATTPIWIALGLRFLGI